MDSSLIRLRCKSEGFGAQSTFSKDRVVSRLLLVALEVSGVGLSGLVSELDATSAVYCSECSSTREARGHNLCSHLYRIFSHYA